ncbi:MAG: OadG family protein [Lachnospiraceae bacterium]|nr:OadG family protein [Lachnospiraceae bacterium]
MKKKIRAILLMLVCVFSLAACGDGSFKPLVEDPHAELDNQVGLLCCYVVQGGVNPAQLDEFDSLKSDEVDELTTNLRQIAVQMGINLHIDFKTLCKGMHSYADARDELGTNDLEDAVNAMNTVMPIPAEDIEYDVKADEVVAEAHFHTTQAGGHDGIVELIFDKDLHVTAITVNTVLELGESMERAGVNTMIGMGTVFIMLIVIAIIISLLKYVPALVDSFKSSPEEKTEESVDKAIAGIVEREEAAADETDDGELIAVIAAAIAASAASEGVTSTDGFVVRSIRRIR